MNYYEILKVPKDANGDNIKTAYKSLVKKYHPDLYVGDKDFAEKKIKEINEAYDVLSNPEKKREYDEYLNPTPQAQQTAYQYNPSNYSDYNKTTNHSQTTQKDEVWSITKWLTDKFNKLDSKQQLRIFILVLVFVLSVLLINLIQLKSYLETGKSPFLKTNSNSKITTQDNLNQNDYYNNSNSNYNYNENFDINTYFDEFLEEYEQYKNEFYQEYNINLEDISLDEENETAEE